MEHLFLIFLGHTQRRSTVGRTPLDEWSASRRDLYLTTHDTHNRKISMPPVGFEPKISAGERLAAARLLRLCYTRYTSCPFRQTTRYIKETNFRCYKTILLYVLTVHRQGICVPIKSRRRRSQDQYGLAYRRRGNCRKLPIRTNNNCNSYNYSSFYL